MFSEEVVIPTAVCEGLVLVLQQDGGKSNIETLIDQVSADKTPEASHPDPPFNIEVLTIKDITVIASGNFTVVNTKPVTAKIDEIVLKNVLNNCWGKWIFRIRKMRTTTINICSISFPSTIPNTFVNTSQDVRCSYCITGAPIHDTPRQLANHTPVT